MTDKHQITTAKDKVLFTPGPLTTSRTVKQAMLRDLGSRDFEFIQRVADIRQRLLQLAGVSKGEYEAILMQGSGTFSLEAVVSSSVPPDGKLLVIINGAYGRRTEAIAKVLKIPTVALNTSEDSQLDLGQIETALAADPSITHVAVVHCETTSDVRDLLAAIRKTKTEMGIR